MNPEAVDPQWFQELVRRAFDRELCRLIQQGATDAAAWQQAMWFVFDIRTNLTALYQAGAGDITEASS